MTTVDNLNGLELLSGRLVTLFLTLAEAEEAVKSLPAGTHIKVTNDPNPDLNGEYTWDGEKLLKTTNNTLEKAKEQAEEVAQEIIDRNVTASHVLDLLEGQITGSLLDRRLEQRIEKIPSIVGEIEELKNEVTTINYDLGVKVNYINFDLEKLTQYVEELELIVDVDFSEIKQQIQDLHDQVNSDFEAVRVKIDELQAQVTADFEKVRQEVKDLQAQVDADIKKLQKEVADKFLEVDQIKIGLDKEIQDRIEAVKAETEARVEGIRLLNDGLTKEIQERKDGDQKLLTNIENYKTSNDKALANVREQVTVAVDTANASAQKVEALDARVVSAENNSKTALENSASAVTKVNALASDVGAMSEKVDTLEANVIKAVDDSGKALTNSATAISQSKTAVDKANAVSEQVNVVEAKLNDKSTTYRTNTAPTKATHPNLTIGDVWINQDNKNEQKRWDGKAWVDINDVRVSDNATAISKTNATVTEQGKTIQANVQKIDSLTASLGDKADASALTKLESTVTKQGTDIQANAKNITSLQGQIKDKADAKALNELSTKVTEHDGRITSQGESITALNNQIKDKADASAVNQLKSTVTQQGKDIASQGQSITKVEASVKDVDAIAKDSKLLAMYQGQGKLMWDDPTFKKSDNSIKVYSKNDAIHILERVPVGSGNPTGSTHEMLDKIVGDVNTGNYGIYPANLATAIDKVFLHKYVVKIPVNYRMSKASNAIGTGGVDDFIGGTKGTGNYEVYWRLTRCGSSGTFSTTGHVALKRISGTIPTPANPDEVRFAQVAIFDVTDAPDSIPKELLDKVDANATAISNLNAEVKRVDGAVIAQGKQITQINSDLGKKADSSALTSLESKVTQQGDTITAQGKQITSVEGQLKDKASTQALNTLDAKVVKQGETITAQGQALTGLKQEVDGKASVQAVDELKTTVTQQGKDITAHGQSLTSLQNQMKDKADAKALTALETKVTKQGDDIKSQGEAITSVEAHLDGMIIGGSNLIRKTDIQAGYLKSYVPNVLTFPALPKARTPVARSLTGSGASVGVNTISDISLKAGQEYTLSFRGASSKGAFTYAYVMLNNSGASNIPLLLNNKPVSKVESVLTYVSATFKCTHDVDTAHIMFACNGAVASDWVLVAEPMLVEGNTGTTWSKSIDELAGSEALNELKATVGKQGETITAQGQSITGLKQEVDGKASSQAVNELKSTVTQQGKDIATQGQAITTLNNQIKDKADAKALTALETKVTENSGKIESQGTALTGVKASLGAMDSDSLTPDFLMANPESWYSHYSYPMAQYFKTTATGKIAPTVFRKDGSNPSSCWNYNMQNLPNDRAYKVSFWIRRSADSTGANYVTIAMAKSDGIFAQVNYTHAGAFNITNNEEWVKYEKVVDNRSQAETYPQIRIGFAICHGGDKGWGEVQGFKVQPVLETGDVGSSIATADSVSKLSATVTQQGNTITSQGTAITGLENSIKDKADAKAVNELKTTVTQQGNEIKSQGLSITKVEAKLSNVVVGNENLLSKGKWLDPAMTTVNKADGYSFRLTKKEAPFTGNWARFGMWNDLQVGTEVVFSYKIKVMDAVKTNIGGHFGGFTVSEVLLDGVVIEGARYSEGTTINLPNDSEFHHLVVKAKKVGADTGIYIQPNRATAYTTPYDVMVKEVMFSEGNTTSSWTSPEDFLSDQVDANAKAISSLDAEVKRVDGIVVAQGKQVTQLKADIDKKADGTALTALETKVTQQGKDITSQGQSITNLNNQIKDKADASAVNSLKTTVDQQGNDIKTNSQNIINLNTNLGNKADASAVTALEAEVKKVDGKTVTNSQSITKLQGQVNTIDGEVKKKADASALNSYYTKVEADKAIAGQISEFNSSLIIGGVNQLVDSERERSSTATSQREYFMYERSVYLKDFYDRNLGKPATISFEIKVPVAGTVQVYSSNNSAHTYSASTPSLKANEWTYVELTVKPAKHGTTPENVAGSTLEFYGTYGTGRIPSVRRVQLEAGTKATDWSVSPRDVSEALEANSTAVGKVEAKTTALEGKVNTQATQISGLQSQINGKADSSALNSLKTTVEQQGNTISSQGTAITQVESSVNNALKAVTVEDTRGTNQPPSWYWTNHPRRVVNEFKIASVIGVTGLGLYVNLETRVYWTDSTGGDIIQVAHSANNSVLQMERNSVGSGDSATWSAWRQPLKAIDDSAKASATAVNKLTTDVTKIDGKVDAQATAVQQLDTKVGNNTASIQTQSQTINGIQANWTMKMDVNGYVSGIGAMNNGNTSEFIIRADRFAIANPTGTGKKYGFVYQSSPNTLPNGTVIPAGLYIDNLILGDIDARKINAESISAISANLGRFESNVAGKGKTVISGTEYQVFDANGVERIFLGVR